MKKCKFEPKSMVLYRNQLFRVIRPLKQINIYKNKQYYILEPFSYLIRDYLNEFHGTCQLIVPECDINGFVTEKYTKSTRKFKIGDYCVYKNTLCAIRDMFKSSRRYYYYIRQLYEFFPLRNEHEPINYYLTYRSDQLKKLVLIKE